MLKSRNTQNRSSYICKPSAIESLIASKRIGKMTGDEYKTLARQAQIVLHEGQRKVVKLPQR